ncbi:MAG: hypothetical protein RLZZ366_1690 [Pseudomonadota bacterium]
MIIDSSALIAILFNEPGWQHLREAIENETSSAIPAPALTETRLVIAGRGQNYAAATERLIAALLKKGVTVVPFEHRHADITAIARDRYGKGNGRGGLLNFGDLMVYAVAKDRGEPLLCTGRDFASTDLEIHPQSRVS